MDCILVTSEAGNGEKAGCSHIEEAPLENRLFLLISFAAGRISSFQFLTILPAQNLVCRPHVS